MKLTIKKFNVATLQSLLEYALVVLVILECRSVYSYTVGKNYPFGSLITVILVGLFFLIFSKKEMKKINSKFFIAAILLLLYLLFYAICSGTDTNQIVKLFNRFGFILLLFTYYWAYCIRTETVMRLLKKYVDVMFLLAIISLFMWVSCTLMGLVKPSGNVWISWGETHAIKSYYNIYYETQNALLLGKSIIRNTGIFTEAPMYSLHLIIAFSLEFFLFKRKSKLIVLAITIITTVSTTGIILLVIFIGLKEIIKIFSVNYQKMKVVDLIRIVIIPVAAILMAVTVISLLTAKFGRTSGMTRMDDYTAGFLVWKQHLFVGAGYGDNGRVEQYMGNFRSNNRGFSNSLMIILMEGGICFGLVYLIPIIKCFWTSIKKKKEALFCITILWVFLLVSTLFPHQILMLTFLAFGYAQFITTKL